MRALPKVLALAFVLAAGPLAAAGGGPYAGLRLLGSARQTGLAGAFGVLGGDQFSAMANPGQGAAGQDFYAAFSHLFWLAGTGVDALAAGAPLGELGRLHLFGGQIAYSPVELRDASGAYKGSFVPAGQMAGLAWGRAFSRSWSLGVQARYLRQDLYVSQFQGSGFGLGLAAGAPADKVRAGLALSMEQGDGLSAAQWAGAFGVAGALWSGPALDVQLAGNVESQASVSLKAAGGVEAWLFERVLALRAGYGWEQGSAGSAGMNAGLAAGFGVRVGSSSLDYGLRSLGGFGWAHHVALSAGFAPLSQSASGPAPAGAQVGPEAAALRQGSAPESSSAAAAGRAVVPGQGVGSPGPGAGIPPAEDLPPAPEITQRLRIVSEGVVRGEALEAQGKWSEALAAYRAAAEAERSDSLAWKGLARAYLHFGKKEYARICVDKLAALDPGDGDLMVLRESLK